MGQWGQPRRSSRLGDTPGSLAIFPAGGVSFGSGAFASSAVSGLFNPDFFPLFTRATLRFTQSGFASFNSDIRAVPEPGLLAMLGVAGLFGMGRTLRGRRHHTAS